VLQRHRSLLFGFAQVPCVSQGFRWRHRQGSLVGTVSA
jgi:hypothetical protein